MSVHVAGVIGTTNCLVVEVKVAPYKLKGSDASLRCHYSLDGATLYSLKWYKGDSQFYQYIPAKQQAKEIFHVPGVEVDVSTYIYIYILTC